MGLAGATASRRRRSARGSRLPGYVVLGLAMCVAVTQVMSPPSTMMTATVTAGNATAVDEEGSTPTLKEAFYKAGAKALHSGTSGFIAGACQVIVFMWLRTAMNYQYKNGGALGETLKKLYAEGGVARLYKGLFPWALLQAPLSRFGDTASNALVLGIRAARYPSVPVEVATVVGSFCGAAFRVMITPIDTCKTTLQTDGAKGWTLLKEKISKSGIFVLWYGWEGNYLANVIGGYPFFVALNFMSHRIPTVEDHLLGLVRQAFIGAVAATISDVTSNSIRVMKTKKQTSSDPNMGYIQAMTDVIASDGLFGFMFRGLDTRIFTNVLQGAFFTVLWRGILKGA